MWYVIQTMKGREEKVADAIRYDVAEADETVFVFENEMEYKVKG
ncbi:transcription termination/antitermination NusG family protein [Oribacterium sp. P6A1]|nr:transcription termination/antitermination NusG family protein [Oribacterium sp. P6A1]